MSFLDILGAAVKKAMAPDPAAVKKKAAAHKASADKLTKAGAKLAKKHPKLGAAMQKLGAAHSKRADNAIKAANTPPVTTPAPKPAAKVAPKPAAKAVPAKVAPKAKIHGDAISDAQAAMNSTIRNVTNAIDGRTAAQIASGAPQYSAQYVPPVDLDPDSVDTMANLATTMLSLQTILAQFPAAAASGMSAMMAPNSTTSSLISSARSPLLSNIQFNGELAELLGLTPSAALTSLQQQGQSLLDQATTLTNGQADTAATGDITAIQTAATQANSIIAQANTWISQANAALGGTVAGTTSNAWAPSTSYTVGAQVTNAGNLYQCVVAGTSAASGGPLGTQLTSAQVDGTASWAYKGPAPAIAGVAGQWTPSTAYAVGVQVTNAGTQYQCITAGTSASSGGPAGTVGIIQDGSVQWIASASSAAQWVSGTNYTVGAQVTNVGNTYQCIKAGTSQVGGSGPTAMSGTMIDGSVTWIYTGAAATAATPPGGFDPGSGGGGGGGGGGDDGGGSGSGGGGSDDGGGGDDGGSGDDGSGGGSSALARFRQSGGADDPFDDGSGGGGGGGSDDGGGGDADFSQTGGGAFESDGPQEATDAAKQLLDSGDDIMGGDTPYVSTDPYTLMNAAVAQKRLAQAQANVAYVPQAGAAASPVVSQNFLAALAAGQSSLQSQIDTVQGIDDLLEYDELDDITTQGFSAEITDQDPDFERRHGSMHYGAAAGQDITYPPGGASSGQEGGEMPDYDEQENIRIHGADLPTPVPPQHDDDSDFIFGGAAYAHGVDVLGAGPAVKPMPAAAKKAQAVMPRVGIVQKTTPAGNKITAIKVNPSKKRDNKTSVANARDVAKRAAAVAAKLAAAADKTPAKPATPPAKSVIHGLVAKAAKGVGKPIPHMTNAQMKAVAKALAKDAAKHSTSADKHETLYKAQDKKVATGSSALAQKLTDPKIAASISKAATGGKAPAKTKVKGDVIFGELAAAAADAEFDIVLGEAAIDIILGAQDVDIFGAIVMAAGDVDPNAQPDPNADPSADPNADPNAAAASTGDATSSNGTPGPPGYGMPPVPTAASAAPQPGADFQPDPGITTDGVAYSSTPTGSQAPVPLGAIYYDGSKGTPDWCFRSFNSYSNPQECIYWKSGHWDCATGGWSGLLSEATGGNDHVRQVAQQLAGVASGPGGFAGNLGVPSGIGTSSGTPIVNALSIALNWGPLVGAIEPSSPLHGLRYDAGQDKWFWFYDTAPTWAQAPVAAVALNQAILDWQTNLTAAKQDYAAAILQDKTDADTADQSAKQQAADDAATAHQQDQETQQAAHEADIQSQADQVAQGQASAAADIQVKQQTAQADIDRADQAQQFQQEKDAYAAAAAAGQVPPDDGSADGANATDGSQDDGGGTDDDGSDMDAESDSDDPSAILERDDNEGGNDDTVMGIAKLKSRRNRHQ